MNSIQNHIEKLNQRKRKALSIFLTAGFPDPDHFAALALKILEAGADILEIGIPFSDPIADGPVIQRSSMEALARGVSLSTVFPYIEQIKSQTAKPVILMGYANPIQHYGLQHFLDDAGSAGADGVIIPDIPLEEYNAFWQQQTSKLSRILLTTPTSPAARIKKIDQKSEGFVYCVSVTGTTGIRTGFNEAVLNNLARTYQLISKNKMMIGFGISGPEDIHLFAPYCDGVIVGSAVINHLEADHTSGFENTCSFIKNLSNACQTL